MRPPGPADPPHWEPETDPCVHEEPAPQWMVWLMYGVIIAVYVFITACGVASCIAGQH